MSPQIRAERAAFLGVEQSLTGRRWAARLGDERSGAGHRPAPRPARRRGAAAGGARRRSRGRAGFPRPDAAQVPARSAASQGHGRRRGAAGARGARGRAHRRVRRLRRRRRHVVGAAAALLPQRRRQYRRLHPRSPQGGLRPQRAGAAEAQAGGRRRGGHGRLRRHRLRAAGRGQARRPRPDRDRPPPGRDRAARGHRRGRSQPDRRCQPAQADGGGRRGVPALRRRQPRAARGGLVQAASASGPSPTCGNGSTSWRWARCAMSCRSPASIARWCARACW